MSDWFRSKTDLIVYICNKGAVQIDNDLWELKGKKISLLEDKSEKRRGWIFGYL